MYSEPPASPPHNGFEDPSEELGADDIIDRNF